MASWAFANTLTYDFVMRINSFRGSLYDILDATLADVQTKNVHQQLLKLSSWQTSFTQQIGYKR